MLNENPISLVNKKRITPYIKQENMGNKEFIKELSLDGEDRLRIKIEVEKGKVMDVVVQYESKIKDRWEWYKERFKKGMK